MNKQLNINNLNDLEKITNNILSNCSLRKIAIDGTLGVGKTTLVKNFCKNLGVIDHVSSPTFPIINEYSTKSNEKIYHFDFYRLNSFQEAIEIGTDLYLDTDSYCFIEWPELILPLLNKDVLFLSIKIEKQNRVLTII